MNVISTGSNLLPEDYIQRVINTNDLVDVVGEHVSLKRTGHQYTGLCPFHSEKSPSFSVNPSKQVYLCRGCGATGGVLRFMEEHQGMPFLEAIEALARRVNLPPPSAMRSSQGTQQSHEYRQLLQINERASDLYHEQLLGNPEVLEYLSGRGVTQEMIRQYKLGFAPGGGFLLKAMQDVAPEMLMKAGLVNIGREDGNYRDWMNHRVIFPIRNQSGQAIAFGGRTLSPNVSSKYINTPESVLFRKGQELYGWYEAKNHIHKSKTAIVCEGYLDTVIPSGNGVHNIVSVMGATIQAPTIERLMKSAERIVFCFDGDKAGLMAAKRALEQALPLIDEHHQCAFAFLPDGYDPDEYVIEFGSEKFVELLAGAEPLSRFLIRSTAERYDLNEIEGQARFAKDAMVQVNQIRSETIRALLTKGIKDRIGADVPLDALHPTSHQGNLSIPGHPGHHGHSRTVLPVMGVRLSEGAGAMSIASGAGLGADGQQGSGRSLFGGRSSLVRSLNKPAPVQAPTQAPSLALRIVGMLVRDPEAARAFNPAWVNYAPKAQANEIAAVAAIVELCTNEPDKTQDRQSLLERLNGSGHEETVRKACLLHDSATGSDPVEELGKLAFFLIQCKEREIKRASIFKKAQA